MSEVTKQEQDLDHLDKQEDLETQDKTQVIEQCLTIQGIDYYIERENFYDDYYMYNPYAPQIDGDTAEARRCYEGEAEHQEVIYLGSQYNGSYIQENASTGEWLSYWYYPFYTLYPCYGNYAYNKPAWLVGRSN